MTTQRIVMLGGTGFVGSYLVPRLAADGHRITLLSRNREQHRDLAVLPGVSIRSADVYDDSVLWRYCDGADTVINLIGILNNIGRHTFQRAHVDMARRLIDVCQTAGVQRLHQMSSLKAGQGQS
ncbi:MAG TPA: NAD-dependent epimerase/dehydratase family protein, partial [Dyella sp.]|nr:NAD-dependent epimerase/dehydratase family protein [Dyella sp.]